MKNIFTIDVENLHHRLAYKNECEVKKQYFPDSSFEGVERFVNLLKKYNHTATFFVIGEVLEQNPNVAKIIVENGHEIANHTYSHTELKNFSSDNKFQTSIKKTDDLIYNICGAKSVGFRAPKWAILEDMSSIINFLIESGYRYDSSLFPAKGYGYGNQNSLFYPYRMSESNFFKQSEDSNFFEFPTLIYKLGPIRIPIKLRHFGTTFYDRAIKKMNKLGHPAVVTLHSWELVELPHNFKTLGNYSKNFLRNFRIPCQRQIEKLLQNHNFVSISDFLNNQ